MKFKQAHLKSEISEKVVLEPRIMFERCARRDVSLAMPDSHAGLGREARMLFNGTKYLNPYQK
jgi:hypothetical protein